MSDINTLQLEHDDGCVLPPELVSRVLAFGGAATELLASRRVCRQWRDVADHLAQRSELWQRFCKTEYYQTYLSVVEKSVMSWFNVYRNIRLWSRIERTHKRQSLMVTFNDCAIRKIHVAKDMLIVVYNNGIKLYKIKSSDIDLITELTGYYLDCQQNKHMNLLLTEDRQLTLFGKTDDVTPFEMQNELNVGVTDLYSLEGNCCYFVNSKNELWGYRWESTCWQGDFLARYYAPVPLKLLQVRSGRVHVLTKAGAIMRLLKEQKQLGKVDSTSFPSHGNKTAFLVNACDVVYDSSSMKNSQRRTNKDHVEIPIANLSCLVAHADMLIVGTKMGEVVIYSWDGPRRSIKREREVVWEPTETIVAMDVFESEAEHTVFIGSYRSIYKVDFRHDYLNM